MCLCEAPCSLSFWNMPESLPALSPFLFVQQLEICLQLLEVQLELLKCLKIILCSTLKRKLGLCKLFCAKEEIVETLKIVYFVILCSKRLTSFCAVKNQREKLSACTTVLKSMELHQQGI